MEGHNSFVNSVAYNHNGTLLISGSADSTIKLWNPYNYSKFEYFGTLKTLY